MNSEGNFVTGDKGAKVNRELLNQINKAPGTYSLRGTITTAGLIKEGGKLWEYRIAELGDRKLIGYIPATVANGAEDIEIEVKKDQTGRLDAWIKRIGAQGPAQGSRPQGRAYTPRSEREYLAGPMATVVGECVKASKGDPEAFDAIADRALNRFATAVAKLRG